MVTCICVRGSALAQFDTVLVLLFGGRTPCSTSYFSRRKNTSTLRVITLRGKNSLLYELLLSEKEEHFHPTSQEYFHSTSNYSPSRKLSALRVTSLQARRSLLYELLLFKQEDLCSTSSPGPIRYCFGITLRG